MGKIEKSPNQKGIVNQPVVGATLKKNAASVVKMDATKPMTAGQINVSLKLIVNLKIISKKI
jgi:hypothetical protein